MPSEAELQPLVEAAAAGDRSAIDRLIEHYLPRLRAFVRLRAGPLVRARESDSDLVQSVCREVLEHADRFRFGGESAFRHWLFATALRKIAKRREFHLAEKRDPGREVAGGDEREAQLLRAYSSFTTPSRNAILREELERIENAFDKLSEEQREVIVLAHVVGLSRAEIAERTDRNEGAVRVLLHRALARVAVLLGEGKETN